MSARTATLDALAVILASHPDLEDVRLIRSARPVGEVGKTPILQVRTTQWEPTPQAPLRNVTWTGTATLVSPHRDLDRAEDDLEKRLEALSTRLRTASFAWTVGTLTDYDDQHISIDITLTAIFQKEN